MPTNVVIIGAGQGGLTAAVALREHGWSGGIHLVGEERHAPYQRPPLSKGYLSGAETRDDLLLRAPEALERDGIVFHTGVRVTRIDRDRRVVELETGEALDYAAVILATGSAPRKLTLPGAELAGIHSVRTVDNVDALRADFARGGPTVFIGGGFLNLEVAIEAAKHGPVTVLEMAPQILGRVLSREAAAVLAEYHADLGIEIRCGVDIVSLVGVEGQVTGVELAGGSVEPAARVVLAIGADPRDELAQAAGLETAGGVVVDAGLRTSDEAIYAVGDCAKYPSPFAGIEMRVESVQNATDQGRFVAARIAGTSATDRYIDVPWFWSTQGERKLQIAGLAMPTDEARVVLHEENGKLVVERLREGQVVAVETVNAPGPHMRARKSLASLVTAVQV